jgi:acetyl-CoA acetyltransferase
VSANENDIAIVAFAQTPSYAHFNNSEPAMIMPLVNDVIGQTGLDRHDIDFTIAGSCDYLSGLPFAFVMNIDAVGAWPPVYESHVEMDGAFAMFEGFVRLKCGDIDTALVSGSGKSSPGNPRVFTALQSDPYVMAPLGVDHVSLGAIQARMLLEAGKVTEEELGAIAVRCREAGAKNPYAQITDALSLEDYLAQPLYNAPLRQADIAPTSDGAAAVILARGKKAYDLCDNPVWIRAVDHRMESHHPGLRDLTTSVSTRMAAEKVGLHDGPVDIAELNTLFTHEEVILREALGLGDGTKVNPSGGPLVGNPTMAVGLARVIEVARAIQNGEARRGVAHCSSGSALQQNLLVVLEGDK